MTGQTHLGGGFKYFLNFHPYLGKISNLTSIFFKWVGSTTNQTCAPIVRTDVIAFSAAISACVREGAAPWVDDS